MMIVNDSGQRMVFEFSRSGSLLREVSNEIKTPFLNEMHFGVFAYRKGYLYGILPGEEFGTYELVRVSVKTGKGERLTDSLSIFSVTGSVFSFSGDWVYTTGKHGNGKHYWEPYLILYNLRTGVRQELLFNAIIQKEFDRPFLDGPNLYFPLNEEKSDGGQEFVLYHYFIDGDEVQFQQEIRLYEDVNCDKLVCNGQTGRSAACGISGVLTPTFPPYSPLEKPDIRTIRMIYLRIDGCSSGIRKRMSGSSRI